MAVLTVQRATTAGVAITLDAAAGGGDSFANDGNTVFRIANGAGSPMTVTFDSPNTCDFGISANAAHDRAVVVSNGVTLEIGPFAQARFNDSNGRVQVTYSDATSVTVAAIAR